MLEGIKYGRVINLVMNIILGLGMSLVVLIALKAPISSDSIIEAWFASFCIGYTFGDIIPIGSAGPALCRTLKIKNSFGNYIITAIINGLYFGTIILFGNMLVNNLLMGTGWGAMFGGFVALWPVVAVSAIALVLIFLWLAQLIAKAATGFDPRAAADELAMH